jgi:hypothetical protein
MKKKTLVGLVVSSLLICLLGLSILTAIQDEPPPDVSDLELSFPLPARDSFRERVRRGELDISSWFSDAAEEIDNKTREKYPSLSSPEIHKKWDTQQMDTEVFAVIPSEFWKNFDSILQAPSGRAIERDYSPGTNFNAATIVKYKALRMAQQGNADDGLRMAAKIVLLGKRISENGCSIIDLLRSTNIRDFGYCTMGEIIGNYPVSPECLREIRQLVEKSRVSNDEVGGLLKGEFCCGRQWFSDGILDNINELKRLIGSKAPPGNFLTIPYAMDVCPQVILFRRNETLRHYAEITREILLWPDYNEQKLNKASSDLEDKVRQYAKGRFSYDPSNAAGRALLLWGPSSFGIYLNSRLQTESKASAVEAMLAAREYELKHGKLPESLERLIPEYFPAVPTDYMDDLPIRYSPQARAIWTVGLNQSVNEPLPAPEEKDAREDCIFRLLPLTK